jgi:SAM-dependent methyltransferase
MTSLRLLPFLFLLTAVSASAPGPALAQGVDSTDTPLVDSTPADTSVDPDVPFVRSPQRIVDRMLQLADVSGEDVVYDLGSGDGRIPITAAQTYGARGVGIEIKPDLVLEARQNAEDAGVDDLVEFRQGDLFEADFSNATVVTLYLLPDVNEKLRPMLFEQLEPGTRVVSHGFDMGEWEADKVVEFEDTFVFLWTIPEEIPSHLKEE